MDPAYLAAHLDADRDHWWFQGRRAVIIAVLERLLAPDRHRLLDVGCGSGNVLEALGRFGEAVGMEANESLVAAGRRAGLDVRRGVLPDDRVVPAGWPDVVLLLDVLEHVDDGAALRAARALLQPGGLLVATVPAYQWLWSAHDVALGHRRRYTASRLRAVIGASGFTVVSLSHFNTLLLPCVALVRTLKRLRGAGGHDLAQPSPLVNGLLARVFSLEAAVVPRCPLPCGASLIVVGRR
jgi:2-polyprenyl-3-methyl-5-hydroxy-6-metoxy-1,4-benzoquinol methylase